MDTIDWDERGSDRGESSLLLMGGRLTRRKVKVHQLAERIGGRDVRVKDEKGLISAQAILCKEEGASCTQSDGAWGVGRQPMQGRGV